MKKKVLAIFTAICLVLSLSGVAAFAIPFGYPIYLTASSQSITLGESVFFTATSIDDSYVDILYIECQDDGDVVGNRSVYYPDTAGKHTFRAYGIDESGATVESNVVTITVKDVKREITPPRITTQPKDKSAYVGDSVSFSVKVDNPDKFNLTYQWYHGNSYCASEGATLTIKKVDDFDKGDYYCVVTYTNGSIYDSITSDTAHLDVTGSVSYPYISADPSSKTAKLGSSVSFSVAVDNASGFSISYQWYHGNVTVPNGRDKTLTINNIDYFDEGDYYCVIQYTSSKLGNGSDTSKTAYLEVTGVASDPYIISQPKSSSVKKGGTASFSVELQGTEGWDLSYDWYYSSNTYSGGTYMGSGRTLKITNCAYADAGYYYCLVNYRSSSGNTGFVSSSRAYLSVSSNSSSSTTVPYFTQAPANTTVSNGGQATFEVKVANPSNSYTFSYQWYRNSIRISGATSAKYSFYPTAENNGDVFACEVTYRGPKAGTILSSAGKLSVNGVNAPNITMTPATAAIERGAQITITANASAANGASLSYQWYRSEKNTFNTATIINGATSKTYTEYAPTADGVYYYFCHVSAKTGSSTVTDYAVSTVTVGNVISEPTGSMANFTNMRAYRSGMFGDVNEGAWYGADNQGVIKRAYELGLMNGTGDGSVFSPESTFDLSQVIAVAARLHCIYTNGKDTIVQGSGANWYAPYVEYAINNGIISANDFDNYTAAATRAQMAYIFANCLPSGQLNAIRVVSAIPDCNESTPYYPSIRKLYSAGIVSGDGAHNFAPSSYIIRAEAAAIIARVALPAVRNAENI